MGILLMLIAGFFVVAFPVAVIVNLIRKKDEEEE